MKQLFLFTIFLVPIGLFAQSSLENISTPDKKYIKHIDFRIENGAMLSNDTELGDQIVNSSYYNAVDIRLGFQKADPYDIYSNVYRRPTMGVGLYSSTFNNDRVGRPNAIYYWMKFPFTFPESKRLVFSYGGAFGLSYNFNPYDSIKNPTNIFLGSYRNCYVHLEFTANYNLNDRLTFGASLGFKHFSNGSFKQPNFGINLLPVTLGLNYKLGEETVYSEKLPIPTFKRYWLFNIGLIAGSKNYNVGEKNYFKGGITMSYLRAMNYKYRIGAGFDMYYSPFPNHRNNSDASDFSKTYSFAVVGTWEWAFNRNLYVPLGVGVYLHRNPENNEKKPYYFRAGMRYRFNNQMFAGVTIKAHAGVADIFEWTLGYTIGKDPNSYKNP